MPHGIPPNRRWNIGTRHPFKRVSWVPARRLSELMTTQDSLLVQRSRDGDPRAFGELVRRHQDGVFRFVLRMTGSRDEAMDLTQDTFIKAWQALPRWEPQAQFRTWLFQIARNAALDLLRRREALRFVPLEDGAGFIAPQPGPDEQFAQRQRLGLLDAALRQLPPEQREVLLLREIEQLSYAQIAAVLQVQEGTVKSRIARARAALLDRFERATGERDDV
ncbi:MAG TPA: sigma-70 family RNA polymerase sigma factor [Rubrivivax sp.]|nr:sigma-70 family RNA polymerase sigma factor [Rubrivivax sp.]